MVDVNSYPIDTSNTVDFFAGEFNELNARRQSIRFDFEPACEPRQLSRRGKAFAVLALAAIGSLAYVGVDHIAGAGKSTETRMEVCVGDIVGRPVDLETSPHTGLVMRPENISLEAFRACEQ